MNPIWTDDYGSGGNEEGHLLLMRCHYFKTEYVVKAAKVKVLAFLRQLKTHPDRESSYLVNKDSNAEEIETEVNRIARRDAEDFDPSWYPSWWLAFYLFGMPSHGTNSPYLTLTSGKPKAEQSAEEMQNAMADLNTETAPKVIRRAVQKKQTVPVPTAEENINKSMTINHNFVRPKTKISSTERLEKVMELLRGDDIHSDEETGFSKSQKKQEVGMLLINKLLVEDSDNEA